MKCKVWAGGAVAVLMAASLQAAGPMKPRDRQQLVAHLEMTSQWLDDEVKGLSPAQWTYKVSPDSWSVANVLDHLSVRWRVESHGPAGDVVRHRSHPPGAYD